MNFDTIEKSMQARKHGARERERNWEDRNRSSEVRATTENSLFRALTELTSSTSPLTVPVRGLGPSLFVQGLKSMFVVSSRVINLVARTPKAYFDPLLTQARVHPASSPGIWCLAHTRITDGTGKVLPFAANADVAVTRHPTTESPANTKSLRTRFHHFFSF